jgi:2-polyprenyl-3-methyl-5-hydroxy-6-metoxy-1,4-benzoquinol methylase
MNSMTRCPLCGQRSELYSAGTTEAATYFAVPGHYAIAASEHGQRLEVYRCVTCGHGFSPAALSPAVLRRWYEQAPADAWFVTEEPARRRTARRVLQYLGRLVSPPGQLLDVGAGAGFFLEEAGRGGWQVAGLEPSEWGQRYAREVLHLATVRPGGFEALHTLPVASFQVVTAFDVLEHVLDPAALVAACARVVAPGGVLVLTTPKFDSVLAHLTGRFWYCIFPAHLHYFSTKSLTRLLEQHGFTVERVRTHTRYLGVRYFLARLAWLFGLKPPGPSSSSIKRGLLPLNFGDEFEVYARKQF